MIFDTNILNKVRNFGALKYAASDIVTLLGLSDDQKELFLADFYNETSQVYKFYHQGIKIGEYNVDAELAKKAEKGDVDCITKLYERQQERQVNNLLDEMFS